MTNKRPPILPPQNRFTRALPFVLILVAASLACRALAPDSASPTAAVGGTLSTGPIFTQEAGASQPAAESSAPVETPLSEYPPTQEATPTETGALASPSPTSPTPAAGDAARPRGMPPQSQAAGIQPPERRAELSLLSGLLGFEVTGLDGARLGAVTDFIVNTCETYIIYFVLEPDEALGFASGDRLFIPFEVVTINSGILDAGARSIHLQIDSGQFSGAPAFPAGMPPLPPGWETEVRDFWKGVARVSNLTLGCRVSLPNSGGETVLVYKTAYATQLLGAELRDGLGNPLGTVSEAVLAPESGKLAFFVISRLDGQGWSLVPLRVVNIPRKALQPGETIRLELLTEAEVFVNAPSIEALEIAADSSVQGDAILHWGR